MDGEREIKLLTITRLFQVYAILT